MCRKREETPIQVRSNENCRKLICFVKFNLIQCWYDWENAQKYGESKSCLLLGWWTCLWTMCSSFNNIGCLNTYTTVFLIKKKKLLGSKIGAQLLSTAFHSGTMHMTVLLKCLYNALTDKRTHHMLTYWVYESSLRSKNLLFHRVFILIPGMLHELEAWEAISDRERI